VTVDLADFTGWVVFVDPAGADVPKSLASASATTGSSGPLDWTTGASCPSL
jgi:hypothetical protein